MQSDRHRHRLLSLRQSSLSHQKISTLPAEQIHVELRCAGCAALQPVATGLFEDTGRRAESAYVTAHIWRLQSRLHVVRPARIPLSDVDALHV
jgi:hypothetical protein